MHPYVNDFDLDPEAEAVILVSQAEKDEVKLARLVWWPKLEMMVEHHHPQIGKGARELLQLWVSCSGRETGASSSSLVLVCRE